MKKGLSRILSLACVFALLLTMAIPAFGATITKDPEKNEDLKNAGTTYLLTERMGESVALMSDQSHSEEVGVYSDQGTTFYGTFLKKNNAVAFCTIDTEVMYKVTTTPYTVKNDSGALSWQAGTPVDSYTKTQPTEVAAPTGTPSSEDATAPSKVEIEKSAGAAVEYKVFKTDANGDYVFNAPKTGTVKLNITSEKIFFFDENGKMIVGDENGRVSMPDQFGNPAPWKTTGGTVDGTKTVAQREAEALVKDAAVNFFFTDASGDVGTTLTAKDGVVTALAADGTQKPIEGPFFYTIGVQNALSAFSLTNGGTQTEGYQKDGKAFGGVIVVEGKPDSQGNSQPTATSLYKFEDGVPYSQKVDLDSQADGILTVNTTYDLATNKAGGATSYLISSHKIVNEGDKTEEGTAPIKTIGEDRYIIKEDGSVAQNTKVAADDRLATAPDFYQTEVLGGNIVKIDSKKVDPYDDVEVEVNGVTHRYCLDKTGKLLRNAYRRLIDDASQDDLGVAWYTDDGITYRGWIEAEDAYKYQTVLEDGRYIIVTGLQLIPEGKDPVNQETMIAEGFYLFDANGDQIKTETAEQGGHTYKLDANGVVVEVDGHEPTEADIETYLA